MVDRLEFEELALKSVDPSMGPSITQLKRSPVLDEKKPTIVSFKLGLMCRLSFGILILAVDPARLSSFTSVTFDSLIGAEGIYRSSYTTTSTGILLLDGCCPFHSSIHAHT